jgi:hypothetical protein
MKHSVTFRNPSSPARGRERWVSCQTVVANHGRFCRIGLDGRLEVIKASMLDMSDQQLTPRADTARRQLSRNLAMGAVRNGSWPRS